MDLSFEYIIKLLKSCTITLCLLLTGSNIHAQSKKSKDNNPYLNYSEEVFMDMDFEPNLTTPIVPEKAKEALKKSVLDTAKKLHVAGNIDLMRDDEVIAVTIPTDRLFYPNDTILTDDADAILRPLLAPIEDPMMFKVVIAVHTDDTGSELYREYLSISRLNSVYDWFMNQIEKGHLNENLIIIPFSMASLMPLQPNDSRKKRSENRRLEIYYVPGPKLIDLANKGLL